MSDLHGLVGLTPLQAAQDDIKQLRNKLAEARIENKNLTTRLDNACRELVAHREKARDNNYWAWQGDEYDNLESLVCPVLISANQFQAILKERDQLRQQSAETRRDTERLDWLEKHKVTNTASRRMALYFKDDISHDSLRNAIDHVISKEVSRLTT